ncbi:hypothetical protein AK812_SmicGene38366 [Symbiodinium microadriaticum]|uniref:Uncharacterized protein n=1 Tax=Symbiodinium microadriaticum TaxID=2951 RepID=A0A1Q9CDW3_SYMMI|nr:hypothetical protein AK812_SmicGene38366 [Symbiodinium microadriaticum]
MNQSFLQSRCDEDGFFGTWHDFLTVPENEHGGFVEMKDKKKKKYLGGRYGVAIEEAAEKTESKTHKALDKGKEHKLPALESLRSNKAEYLEAKLALLKVLILDMKDGDSRLALEEVGMYDAIRACLQDGTMSKENYLCRVDAFFSDVEAPEREGELGTEVARTALMLLLRPREISFKKEERVLYVCGLLSLLSSLPVLVLVVAVEVVAAVVVVVVAGGWWMWLMVAVAWWLVVAGTLCWFWCGVGVTAIAIAIPAAIAAAADTAYRVAVVAAAVVIILVGIASTIIISFPIVVPE